MFDEQLSQIPPGSPRSPALLPGLRFRAVLVRGTVLTTLAIFTILTAGIILMEAKVSERKSFVGQSNVTNGTVVDIVDDRSINQIEITYKFRTPQGLEYRRIQSISGDSAYAKVKTGDSIPVEFLIATPSVNRISEREKTKKEPFFFLFFPIFFLSVILGPLAFFRLFRILRDRWIFRRGILATGTVLFVKPSAVFMWWGWSGANTAEVFVHYLDASGAQKEARALCQNDWLLRHLAPGTPVHVAYLPNRPSRAMLLEAYVR